MFKPQFAVLVAAGTKRQTIRTTPKRMPRVGDLESWRQWTGRPYHTPQKELARVELTAVVGFEIRGHGHLVQAGHKIYSPFLMDEIARADGFDSVKAMTDWFETEHGLPFSGILIRAKDLT